MRYERERLAARAIAIDAGKVVLHKYRTGFGVEWKGEDDPVTEADHAANDLILARLRRAFPSDAILSEESSDDLARLEASRVWIVDPLDGTKDFVSRTGDFAVMIGLVVDGLPVVGAVCQPLTGHLWHAEREAGATLERDGVGPEPLRVSDVDDPAAMRLVVTRTHRYPEIEEVMQSLGITKERPLGSVGLKVGALTTRAADLYVHLSLGTKEWDTCAPGLILEEAGGSITDCFGRPLRYNQRDVMRRQGVLASNGRAHERIVEALAPIAERAGLAPTS